jgi:glycosyltransferase involved in cell wall biosynthesis
VQNLPKISIVTPSYNQGQFIEETICSVLDQHYPNLEYIIIDGGSTDNTVEIIKKYEKYLKYWVSEKDRGQSHAINKGLKYCTGDIFNWLNSDDLLTIDSLAYISEMFRKHPQIEVLSGRELHFGLKEEEFKYGTIVHDDLETNLIHGVIYQPSTFWRLPIIKNIGVNEKFQYLMDTDLWIRYVAQEGTGKVAKTDTLLAKFRKHNSSKTMSFSSRFKLERESIQKGIVASQGINWLVDKKDKNRESFIPRYEISQELNIEKLLTIYIEEIIYQKYINSEYRLVNRVIRLAFFHGIINIKIVKYFIKSLFMRAV